MQWELIETGTIFATVTAHVEVGIVQVNAEAILAVAAKYFDLGTVDTGFTASGEGTIVASRVLDAALVQPTGARAWAFSCGQRG